MKTRSRRQFLNRAFQLRRIRMRSIPAWAQTTPKGPIVPRLSSSILKCAAPGRAFRLQFDENHELSFISTRMVAQTVSQRQGMPLPAPTSWLV